MLSNTRLAPPPTPPLPQTAPQTAPTPPAHAAEMDVEALRAAGLPTPNTDAAIADTVELNTPAHAAADFAPQGASFPEVTETEPVELPSLDEPLTGVIRDEALHLRFQSLEVEIDQQLEHAEAQHSELLSEFATNGSPFSDTNINNILRSQHGIDSLHELKTLVQNRDPNAARKLQAYIQQSAINEATGKEIGVDNAYGPNTESQTLQRIREPESTYVNKDLSYRSEGEFVYQFGELENGGTTMEAQANCGPASMAMLMDRMGGEAPTMKDIRKESGAPTGNRKGTYGLDSDQVERGLQSILGEQGIAVETSTQLYKSSEMDTLLSDIREGLDAGKEMMLLTSNLETGGKGHYIVINDVREDGSIVVNDPQDKDGENRVHTADELQQGMKTRSAHKRLTRLISVWGAGE